MKLLAKNAKQMTMIYSMLPTTRTLCVVVVYL